MRLSDAKKPALEWSEAAMLPAQVKTLSGGAALHQLPVLKKLDTASIPPDEKKPAPGTSAHDAQGRALRRAAYRQVRRQGQRANSCVT